MWETNWIAIILAAAASFVVGGLWYGPLFGKAWRREQGITEGEVKSANMARIFGLNYLLTLIAAFILGHVLVTYGSPAVWTSTMIGGGIGLAFVATSVGVICLYTQKSLKLFLIDGAYWTVSYAAMGAVFGLMP